MDAVKIFAGISLNEFLTWIFFFFGEGLIMYYAVIKLFGIKLDWKKLILSAIIYSFFILIVRKIYLFYSIPFGTHSAILAVIFALICYLILNIKFLFSVGASLFTVALLLLGTPIALEILEFTKIPLEKINSNFIYSILIGYSEDVFLVLLIIILHFTKFSVKNTQYQPKR